MLTKSVYVVEADIGVIKIGCSHWPQRRAEQISSHSPAPVRLIAILPGDGRIERSLHAEFAASRSHNEWFRIEGAVAKFVAENFGHGLSIVRPWSECDRSPLHERSAERREKASSAAKARWADPAFRVRQAEYRARRFALKAKGETA